MSLLVELRRLNDLPYDDPEIVALKKEKAFEFLEAELGPTDVEYMRRIAAVGGRSAVLATATSLRTKMTPLRMKQSHSVVTSSPPILP
jgi:hypothetical protein